MGIRQQIAHVLFCSTSGAGYGWGVKKVILNVSPAPTAETKLFIEERPAVKCQILCGLGKLKVVAILHTDCLEVVYLRLQCIKEDLPCGCLFGVWPANDVVGPSVAKRFCPCLQPKGPGHTEC
jgi:hypothetical protein